MANKKLKALLESAPGSTAKLHCRVPAKTLAAIKSDVREVSAVGERGEPIPSAARISEYVAEEYGVPVCATTIRNWLRLLKSGGTI